MGRPLPFRNRIRALREARGLTQAALATGIGMTRQSVIAIEQGRYSPSLEIAFRIAHQLDAPLEEVFIWTGDGTAD